MMASLSAKEQTNIVDISTCKYFSKCAHSSQWVHVNTLVSTRTYFREYVVLKFVLAHTYLQTSAEVCTNYGWSLCRLHV